MDKTSIGVKGSLSGVVTAMCLQPLENVKMALIFPPKELKISKNIVMNLFRATNYINLNEGIRGFFKGNTASMLRAGVGSYFYFSTLRALQNLNSSTQENIKYLNFICSSIARIVSCVVTNPINLIETRFEMLNFKGYSSIFDAINQIYRKQGIFTFFKGGLTSCFKQGLFAGFYYMFYQEFKNIGYNKLSAGIMSGLLSTGISHPFEIIRAKLQTQGIRKNQLANSSLLLQIRNFIKNGGWFKGLTPRLLKKPLSNSFAFFLFENLEELKKQQ